MGGLHLKTVFLLVIKLQQNTEGFFEKSSTQEWNSLVIKREW